MNKRAKTEEMIRNINRQMLGLDTVEWNTPNAFHLTSCRPGAKRIYTLEQNVADPGKSGVNVWFSGYINEVYIYVSGLLAAHLLQPSKGAN